MAPKQRDEYTVGWIAPLVIERVAATRMLDIRHDPLPNELNDTNSYTYGAVHGPTGDHNVVLAAFGGSMGESAASIVANQMWRSFPSLRFVLLVGIGGGVPVPDDEERDVRLGDVVISQPSGTLGGVVQWDFGKETANGFQRTGALSKPPSLLLNATANLAARIELEESTLQENLKASKVPHPSAEDVLFRPEYTHLGGKTCRECDTSQTVEREPRENNAPRVFRGLIASGNRVMKNGAERDRIAAGLGGVLCFEMEAAGLMDNFPCLVVRGISDNSDSHKNDAWHKYAAATAAACAKEVLQIVAPEEAHGLKPIGRLSDEQCDQINNLLVARAEKLRASNDRQAEAIKSLVEEEGVQIRAEVGHEGLQTRVEVKEDGAQTRIEVKREGELTRADSERRFQEKQTKEERDSFMQWLVQASGEKTSQPLPTLIDHVVGDGTWFADSETVRLWRASDVHAVLRCYGDAGVGKTVLSDQIRRRLLGTKASDSTALVLSLYLSYDRRSTQSVENCLKSLFHQLINRTDGEVSQEMINFKAGKFQSPEQNELQALEWFLIAQLTSDALSEVFIVIDGIEELDEMTAQDLENSLMRIRQSASSTKVRVVFFSRTFKDMSTTENIACQERGESCEQSNMPIFWKCDSEDEDHSYIACRPCYDGGARCPGELPEAHTMTISYQQRVEVPDIVIEDYVEYEMRQDASKTGRRRLAKQCREEDGLRERVLATVTERASGSFLVAKYFMQHLKKTQSLLDTLEILADMPNNLHDAYNKFIERLDTLEGNIKRNGQRLLTLCASSSRPLTAKEAAHALALRTREDQRVKRRLADGEFSNERAKVHIETAIDAAQGLVTLELDPMTNERQCRMHLTLRQHLTSDEGRPSWFNDHSRALARIMARLLNHGDLTKPVPNEPPEALQKRFNAFPLYQYVAVHWPEHVKPHQENDTEIQSEMALFLNSPQRISSWIQAASQTRDDDFSDLFVQRNALALHVCAWYGLYAIAARLPNLEKAVNTPDPFFDRPPLVHACRERQVATAKWLIDKGASASVEDSEGQTGLIAAILNRLVEVVELILSRPENVDVNQRMEQMQERTPLILAVTNQPTVLNVYNLEHEAIVQETMIGIESITELLLADSRTDANLRDKDGRTALAWASVGVSDAIFNLFFDDFGAARVQLDAPDNAGHTPLHEAAKHGSLARVERLVQAGANINARDHNHGKDFLGKAIDGAHTHILEYMFDGRFEAAVEERVNIAPKASLQSHPPEHESIATAHYTGFRDRDKQGKTLLHVACDLGYENIVRLLLEKASLNINAQDHNGDTPLHLACGLVAAEHPVETMVMLLLKHEARTDIRDTHGRLPKDVAWQNGHAKILAILQQTDTAPDLSQLTLEPDSQEDTPTYEDYPNVQDLPSWSLAKLGLWNLLKARAERFELVDSEDPSQGWNTLMWALSWGDECVEAFATLLSAGMSVSCADWQGHSVLWFAVNFNAPQCMKLLLQHDVDLEHRDVYGQTALQWALGKDYDDIVALLVVNGADVDSASVGADVKQRALNLCVDGTHHEAVEYLCKKGANPWMTDANGLSPRLRAKLWRDYDSLAILQRYSDLRRVDTGEKKVPEAKPFSDFAATLSRSMTATAQQPSITSTPTED